MTPVLLFPSATRWLFYLTYTLVALVAGRAFGDFGDILAEYTFPASSLVMSPTEPLMYATIPSQNSIAIINTTTLMVEVTVFVGSGPANLAFSPDGSKAYIANSTSNFVAVFDTQSRTVTDSFLIPEQPQDVVFGSLNRLWVLGQTQIFQIDATTGGFDRAEHHRCFCLQRRVRDQPGPKHALLRRLRALSINHVQI